MTTPQQQQRQQQHPDLDLSEASYSSDQESALTTPRETQSVPESQAENQAVVGKVKIAVWAVFGLLAVGFGAATYGLTRREERGDFATRFDDLAHEIIRLSERELDSAFSAMKNLGTTVTSHMLDESSGSLFPQHVVVPHFENQGMSLTEMARLEHFTIAPLIDTNHLEEWSNFAVGNQSWIQEGLDTRLGDEAPTADEIFNYIYQVDGDLVVPQTGPGVNGTYAPVWQQYPAPSDSAIVNFDLFSDPSFETQFYNLATSSSAVLSEIVPLDFLLTDESDASETNHHRSFIMHSLFDDLTSSPPAQQLVGFLVGVFSWKDMLDHRVAEENISIVLHDVCANRFVTYELGSNGISLVGDGDLHDSTFDHLVVSAHLPSFLDANDASPQEDHCMYRMSVYPTEDFRDSFLSLRPLFYAFLAILLFVVTTAVFGAYDFVVQKTQRDVIAKAERTNKLISDLFPRNVKERLLGEEGYGGKPDKNPDEKEAEPLVGTLHSRGRLNSDTRTNPKSKTGSPFDTKPIADLFPNATIMFGDLVGFTAWASVREPTQVFTLLETLFHAFDQIAKKRRVFKVETVGDCYVAATGLPDPRPDHALVMARFAKDCMKRMRELTKQLEATLGPDTGDLSMRIGLHSGPVTAGVLRGEKSRFQLFGDTVNTAARIEATGQRNQIHMSQDTADLLKESGKGHWLKERADTVTPKGKGEMKTFWLESGDAKEEKDDNDDGALTPTASEHDSTSDFGDAEVEDEFKKLGLKDLGLDSDDFDEREQRLVRWNAEVLLKLLKQIVARRIAVDARNKEKGVEVEENNDPVRWPKSGLTPLEEFQEIIQLPEFDEFVAKHEPDPETIEIDDEVVGQLNDFVRIIASMYRQNPFHNFEHASHVAMSVSKLLSRIVAPKQDGLGLGESVHNVEKSEKKRIKSSLHDYTFGITSDPLTQFACVLSALIHDVDHTGVPNVQLVKEKAYIARTYNNKSVAEQNSVDSAWDLLMDVDFRALRNAICANEDEQTRFRHLVVNAVLATDICDKELKKLRNDRWDRAFSDAAAASAGSERDQVNRKATIVIEHLIQASDISHTMQHWHIYRKWNERLYLELLSAYKKGRSEADPSENWYKGELGFFDFYIIPLAKKLKNCGVFGVSCDEYLNYALRNRQEWERKGQEIVANMIQQYRDGGVNLKSVVKLDGIQDSEGAALRSSLMSSETMHGGSSHAPRAILDLETDAMSIDSTPSFAASIAQSYDGCRSIDGCRSVDGSRSLASAADTIHEDDEEDSSAVGKDYGGDDSFYSSGSDESSSDEESDGSDASPTQNDNIDNHINKTITTNSDNSLRLSKSKSLRGSKSKSLHQHLDGEPSRPDASLRGSKSKSLRESSKDKKISAPSAVVPTTVPSPVPKAVDTSKVCHPGRRSSANHNSEWGQESGDSFACDLGESLDKLDLPVHSSGPVQPSTKPSRASSGRTPLGKNVSSSDTCSTPTTQINTDWEHDSADHSLFEDSTTMELYCLQQRINSRLVGSIKNTRAYDKKPSEEQMTFF